MIEDYGWSPELAEQFEPYAAEGWAPARIVVQHRDSYLAVGDEGEVKARAPGRLFHDRDPLDRPVVGDWVAVSPDADGQAFTIQAVLERRTAFVRRAADSQHAPQVMAANVDVAFVVTSLNADLNPRRIERYLAAAWQSGARPVVVLTKADLGGDTHAMAAEIAALAQDCPVITVSARNGVGLDALLAQVGPGETCVLVGSSGAGKSTLVNAFLGEERMATQEIRQTDDQGRHTTSHRELVLLPGGGLILDTPGIRELGLVEADEGLAVVFDDVEALAADCRFNDCGHSHEPGCAIQAALASGELDPGRWAAFQKLGLELAIADSKAAQVAKSAERRRLAPQEKQYKAARKNLRGA